MRPDSVLACPCRTVHVGVLRSKLIPPSRTVIQAVPESSRALDQYPGIRGATAEGTGQKSSAVSRKRFHRALGVAELRRSIADRLAQERVERGGATGVLSTRIEV